MKVAGSVAGVLILLVLALLLAAAPQAQETQPSKKAQGETSKQEYFQDDIHVKPKGLNFKGGEWTCALRECISGKRKTLRDDLFEKLAYLDVNGSPLDGMRFKVKGRNIEVMRDGDSFKWTSDGTPLNYKVCKHNEECQADGIPGAWLKKIKDIEIKEKDKAFRPLRDDETVHLKGKASE